MLRYKPNESDDKEIMEAYSTAIKYRTWGLKNPTTASYDNI